ncbi:MAG: CsgG/HfaB family protein, partial [Chitinivibrionales bacterium]
MNKIIIPLIFFIGMSYGEDSIIVNTQIDHFSIRTVFVNVDIALAAHSPLGDSAKDSDLWQQIYETLLLMHKFNVITRSKINSLLDEQKLSISGLTNEKESYKIGKLVSADAVLFVTVIESSDSTVWETIRLIKVETGEIAFMGKLVYL